MKIIFQIAIWIAIVIACLFLFRGCQQGKDIQVIQDSLNLERAINDTLKIERVKVIHSVDSIYQKNTADSISYNTKIDSQARVIDILKRRFSVTKDSIFTLYGQLKTFYDSHDTVALLAAYAELRQQLSDANNLIFSIQIKRDSADFTRNAEVDRLNGFITQLKGQISTLNSLLLQCTDNASNLAKTGNAALKKVRSGNLWDKMGMIIAALAAILYITK